VKKKVRIVLNSAKTTTGAVCPLRRLDTIMKFYELKRRKPSREKEPGCTEEVASGRGLEPEAVTSSEVCGDSSSDEAESGRGIKTGFNN
jgi:hypothetical protein